MSLEQNNTKVKTYGIIIGIISLALQHLIYLTGHWLAELVNITPILPKIDVIDNAIQIIPIFIIPYVWSYIYWALAPMAISRCKFDYFLDYLAAYLFSCLFGAVILVFVPTYMDRIAEGLTSVQGETFLWKLMQFWYSLDGGDMAYNLAPSFHCINSTIALLGVFKRKEIPLWFRIVSLVSGILTYFATVFVKQHYFIDVVAGIAIGVVGYIICTRWHLGKVFLKPIGWFRKEKAEQ